MRAMYGLECKEAPRKPGYEKQVKMVFGAVGHSLFYAVDPHACGDIINKKAD